MPQSRPLIVAAACLYAGWTLLTWWFEGRIGTLSRPEAALDRAVYAVVVNLGAGLALPLLLLGRLAETPAIIRASGLGQGTPRPIALAAALALGMAAYLLAGAPTSDALVLINAYAQVLVVSVAEVIICWSLPAVALATWRPAPGWLPRIGLLGVSAVLFAIYHFAHSPPFNAPSMVAFLGLVGLVTGAFFLATRDAYATMLFHNVLGTIGVTQALAASGRLDAFTTPQWPLLGTAAAALAIASGWTCCGCGRLAGSPAERAGGKVAGGSRHDARAESAQDIVSQSVSSIRIRKIMEPNWI